MAKTYLSSLKGGTVRIPPEVIMQLNCSDGDEVEFVPSSGGFIIRKKAPLAPNTFSLDDIIAATYSSTELSP